MDKLLWIVGRTVASFGEVQSYDAWEFQGVFDSEHGAVAACRDECYFVGPCQLNEEITHEREDWPGAYYPLATSGGDDGTK